MIAKHLHSVMRIYSHIPRYTEIFLVFFKYGFGDILESLHLKGLLNIQLPSHHDKAPRIHNLKPAVRFRMALEELGPTFVKMGQILSSRRDLVNEEFQKELVKLQEHVPAFDGETAVEILETSLGQSLHDVFKSFDQHPLAAASIAQVHKGVLNSGERVAVKIQRPGIQEVVAMDLAILEDLARIAENHLEEFAALDPVGVIQEFGRTLAEELDFSTEGRNMERFLQQFRGNRHIRIPHVYKEWSSDKVLVMEYIKGAHIDRPEDLRRHHIDGVKLSEQISRLIYQQIFRHGFFHADPHPGNITILPRGVTCLYDYGMMGRLSLTFRQQIATMIVGLSQKNPKQVMHSLLGMSKTGYADDPEKLEVDLDRFSQVHLDRPLKDLHLGALLNRLLELLMEHKLQMKPDFYLGIKALSQVEDIAQKLNPDLNFLKMGTPFAIEVMESKYDPWKLVTELGRSGLELLETIKELPADLQDLYTRIRKGRYSIPIEHRIDPHGYLPLRNTLNHIANRLAETILTASLLICSSVLILSGLPPKWHNIPVLGLIGLILGILLMLRIFLAINKRGGM